MDRRTKPQMSISQTGDKYKILKVVGIKGTQMPSHFSTIYLENNILFQKAIELEKEFT